VATDPLGEDADGNPVYLKDIWPTSAEIADVVRSAVTPDMFAERYADVFKGDAMWQGIETSGGLTYDWPESTYVARTRPISTGMTTEADPAERHRRRPHSGPVRRLDHHRPHLPGRLDQGR
jgi:aconitate hydratase